MIINTIFQNEYFDFSKTDISFRKLCVALRACYKPMENFTVFSVPKYSNSLDEAKLNFERIKYFNEFEINEMKVMEAYDIIYKGKLNPLSESIALSNFIKAYYGGFLYSSNFRKSIDSLLEMLDLNEQSESKLFEIMKTYNVKVQVENQRIDTKDKFREIIKFSLLNIHIYTINIKEALKLVDISTEKLMNNLKAEMMYELS